VFLAFQVAPPTPRTVYVKPFTVGSAAAGAANSVAPLGLLVPIYIDSAQIVRKRLAKKCPAVQIVTTAAEATLQVVFIEKRGNVNGATLQKPDGTVVFQTANRNELGIAKDLCAAIAGL